MKLIIHQNVENWMDAARVGQHTAKVWDAEWPKTIIIKSFGVTYAVTRNTKSLKIRKVLP